MTELIEADKPRWQTLGASEIPVVAGFSLYNESPIDVWLRKVHEKGFDEEDDTGQPTEMGREAEPFLAHMYQKRRPGVLLFRGKRYRHPEHDWMTCSPDYLVIDKPGEGGTYVQPDTEDERAVLLISRGLELKLVGTMMRSGWDVESPLGPPKSVIAQCQWSMAVTGLDKWDVGAMLGGNSFYLTEIPRHEQLIANLVGIGEEFMGYVRRRVPPPVDASESYKKYLTELIPQEDADTELPLDDQTLALVEQFWAYGRAKKHLEAHYTLLGNKLRQILGRCAKIRGPFGSITYKRPAPYQKTEWGEVANSQYRLIREKFGEDSEVWEWFNRVHTELVINATHEYQNERTLCPHWKKRWSPLTIPNVETTRDPDAED